MLNCSEKHTTSLQTSSDGSHCFVQAFEETEEYSKCSLYAAVAKSVLSLIARLVPNLYSGIGCAQINLFSAQNYIYLCITFNHRINSLWKAYPRGQRGRDNFKLVKEPALVRIQQPSILTNNWEYASKRRSPDIVLYDRVSKIRCRDLSLPH